MPIKRFVGLNSRINVLETLFSSLDERRSSTKSCGAGSQGFAQNP
jgi:hypothetical protein